MVPPVAVTNDVAVAPNRATAPQLPATTRHAQGLAPTPPRLKVVAPSRPHRVPLFVGIGAVVVLAVMFGFAAFHSQMATNQYELEEIQRELVLENERIGDLELQLDQLNSPAFIERMARGAIGMVDPETPVDIVVADELLLDVASRSATTSGSQ